MHQDHELHTRRKGRNFGILGVLFAFVVLIFGLTVVKIQTGTYAEAFDHVVRQALVAQSDGQRSCRRVDGFNRDRHGRDGLGGGAAL